MMDFLDSKTFPDGFKVSFYKKSESIQWDDELQELKKTYQDLCKTWHEKRQREFLLGRHLIHLALRNEDLEWKKPILIGEKREPLFPDTISGSITHNENVVIFGFQQGKKIVGIDVESRGRVKERLEKEILREEDKSLIDSYQGELSREDLLTLFFSAKESCYKGLYPFVKEYFGFKDAYLESLDFKQNKFKIVVLKDFQNLPNELENPLCLEGFFSMDASNIFTYLAQLAPSNIK